MPADSGRAYVDPFEHVLPGFFAGPIALMMHVFRFQRMKDAFHHGMVPAVPAPTHAHRQAVSASTSRYRVAAYGPYWCAPPGPLLSQAVPSPPGHDPTRGEIAPHRQRAPALDGQTYVMAPAYTRVSAATANGRVRVFGTTGYGCAESVRSPFLDRLGADAACTHQSSDTVGTYPLALGRERRVEPGAAVGPPRRRLDPPDFGK